MNIEIPDKYAKDTKDIGKPPTKMSPLHTTMNNLLDYGSGILMFHLLQRERK